MNSLVAADYGSGSSDQYSSDEDDQQNKSIRLSATSASYNDINKSTTSTIDNNEYFLSNDDSNSSSDSDNENECKYVCLYGCL